jgi:hypothetical protein
MPPSANAQAVAIALAADLSAAADLPALRRWFYTQNGERFGPITAPELRVVAQLEFVGPLDHVRCGLDGEWVQAQQVVGLFARSP